MPYVKRERQRELSPDHERLVSALIREMRPKTLVEDVFADRDAPKIIEEKMRHSDRLQVFVIWNQWLGVREDHRTAAILSAYERELGQEYARRVVIALGVTPDEATELGIKD